MQNQASSEISFPNSVPIMMATGMACLGVAWGAYQMFAWKMNMGIAQAQILKNWPSDLEDRRTILLFAAAFAVFGCALVGRAIGLTMESCSRKRSSM